jgi:hypothetical protein
MGLDLAAADRQISLGAGVQPRERKGDERDAESVARVAIGREVQARERAQADAARVYASEPRVQVPMMPAQRSEELNIRLPNI